MLKTSDNYTNYSHKIDVKDIHKLYTFYKFIQTQIKKVKKNANVISEGTNVLLLHGKNHVLLPG